MWDNVVESVEALKGGGGERRGGGEGGERRGSGCILAHCMGLGKTLSVRTLAPPSLNLALTALTRGFSIFEWQT